MAFSLLDLVFWFTLIIDQATAALPIDTAVRVRTPQGRSPHDVVQEVRREVVASANGTNGLNHRITQTLDSSWQDSVLLHLGTKQSVGVGEKGGIGTRQGVEIVCKTCYIKGTAAGELFSGSTNASNTSQLIQGAVDQVEGTVEALASNLTDYLEDYLYGLVDDIQDLRIPDVELPTFEYDFDIDIPTVPEVVLRFGFEGLELYMELDTSLSLGTTYTLNLYKSQSVAGVSLTDRLSLGIFFDLDLILDVEGSIDISTGFHLKLDDGLMFEIALFSDEVSDIDFKGGKFEFLPVTIEDAGVVFKAVLQLRLHAGLELGVDWDAPGPMDVDFSTGVDVGIFANVAELTTNITHVFDDTDLDCEIGVEQNYQFAVGARAGASIAINDNTWGPVPVTTIPIWSTTLDPACAVQGKPPMTTSSSNNITTSQVMNKRQAMSTATITTEITYTGVNCLSTGVINCPASLQHTSQSTTSTTFTTVVPSGTDEDDIPLPGSPQHSAVTTVDFGANAVTLTSTSGSPISYTPPPPTSTGDNNSTEHEQPLEDGPNRINSDVVIGVCVGLGIPILLTIIATVFIVRKKRERPTDRLSNEELDAKIPPSDDPVAWIDTTPRGQHATRLLSDHEH